MGRNATDMKTNRLTFLSSALDAEKWSASRYCGFTLNTHWTRDWVGPTEKRNKSCVFWEWNSDSWAVTISTELTRILHTRSGSFPLAELTAFKMKLFIPLHEHKSMCLLQFRVFDCGRWGEWWRREPLVICQAS